MKHSMMIGTLALGAGLLFLTVLMDVSEASAKEQCGVASWYQLTSKTASGEYANPNKMTAAHKHLRFGQKIQVKNMRNGKTVVVRVNDRGPFVKGRVLDVTRIAAQKLGFKNAGTTRVCFKTVK